MRSLRGQLLLAGTALEDPNFRRTVVLVGEHGDEGAMGIVLNRPSAVLVDDAVPVISSFAGPDQAVYLGGPVQPQAVVVLADFADPAKANLVVESVGFLPGEIDDVGKLGDLRRVRVFAGYAGWAPGQLEGEVSRGDWHVLRADAKTIFEKNPAKLWQELDGRLSRTPVRLDTEGMRAQPRW